jgi:rod shape-determining protein MreD
MQDYSLILASIFFACILTIVPFPDGTAEFRPEWIAMVAFYWAAFKPDRFGISAAWMCGLLLDVMDGTFLGMQAFTVAAIAYVALVMQHRLSKYPFSYQSVIVFLTVGIHLTAVHWLQGLFSVVSGGYSYLIPALSSGLLWTVVALLLMSLQHGLKH